MTDLCEIERILGFTYPPSFHSLIEEFTTLCSTQGFKQAFPAAKLLLSAPDIFKERENMDIRENLGVAVGPPLPVEWDTDFSSSTLVPFLRDEQPQWPDTYAFDLESQGPEYYVVVWSYSDPMVVHDWNGFPVFLRWMREFIASG